MKDYDQMQDLNLPYDSKQQFHKQHPDLLYNSTNRLFDCIFQDEDGTTFLAAGDFYDPLTERWIELKSAALNKHSSKKEADEALSTALRFAKTDKTKLVAILSHGWNHSVNKQKIVQTALAKRGINLIVIFTDNTKLTYRANGDINKMRDVDLHWCYHQQYDALLCA